MALHNELGRKGEQLGEDYLANCGYSILFRNWRYGRSEIDLVAAKDNVLHFIEVKTRRAAGFGLPEEAIDKKKLRRMITAGSKFINSYPQWKRIQFDILSVSIINNEVSYFLIEDAYL